MDSDGYLVQVLPGLSISYFYIRTTIFAIYFTFVLRILRYSSVCSEYSVVVILACPVFQHSESPTEYALHTEYACVQSSLKVREKVRIYHHSTQTEDLTM